MSAIYKNGTYYGSGSGGGSSYTAGDGIVIDNDEISVDEMSQADMSEIVTPLPSIPTRQMIYSTTEQVIGKWIDGKPIYQKTVNFGALNSGSLNYISHNIQNVDVFCQYDGFVKLNSGVYVPLTRTSVDSNTYNTWHLSISDFDSTQFVVHPGTGYTGNSAAIISGFVTLQYTKSTDTAQ